MKTYTVKNITNGSLSVANRTLKKGDEVVVTEKEFLSRKKVFVALSSKGMIELNVGDKKPMNKPVEAPVVEETVVVEEAPVEEATVEEAPVNEKPVENKEEKSKKQRRRR